MNSSSIFIVADDHALIRSGMKTLLQLLAEGCVVREAATADELMTMLNELGESFTLLFLDLGLPDCKGIAVLERVLTRVPGKKICIISGETNPAVISVCLDLDVLGFIPKALDDDNEFTSSLQQLIQGNPCYPRIQNLLSERSQDSRLSEKQRNILQSLCMGESYESIARTMGISIHGVHYHVREIFRKMNVNNRMQAVHIAREKLLID